jgi:hypothetical protein
MNLAAVRRDTLAAARRETIENLADVIDRCRVAG